jgi:hypothetical protein
MFTDAALNTPEAKYAAAVLLAHLRRIKAANAGDHNHELNQGADNWLAKSQAQINTAITNMTQAQIKLFQEYEAARVAVANGSADSKDVALNAAVARANHNDFGAVDAGLFTKVLNRANELDLNSFRK